MTAADAAIQRKKIHKTIDKIMMSRLPADTKVAMIRAQYEKLRELREMHES